MQLGDAAHSGFSRVERPDTASAIATILDGVRNPQAHGPVDRLCLAVAEQIAGAQCGLIGEYGDTAPCLNDIMISESDWRAFIRGKMPGAQSASTLGFCERLHRAGKPMLSSGGADRADDLSADFSFLGVPLLREGQTVGMIVLGSHLRNFSEADLHAVEQLRPVIEYALQIGHKPGQADQERLLQTALNHHRTRNAELQNRLRNLFAVVRSVFERTVARGGDLAEVCDHFSGRLDALARTQFALLSNRGGSAQLEDLIRGELLSAGTGDDPVLRIDGPAVELPPPIAEALGLAIHELTTNAVKFGALKAAGGRLEIAWRLVGTGESQQSLELDWRENGVPIVPVRPDRGFGTELIEDALPYRIAARTSLRFVGGGVNCNIVVPLNG